MSHTCDSVPTYNQIYVCLAFSPVDCGRSHAPQSYRKQSQLVLVSKRKILYLLYSYQY